MFGLDLRTWLVLGLLAAMVTFWQVDRARQYDAGETAARNECQRAQLQAKSDAFDKHTAAEATSAADAREREDKRIADLAEIQKRAERALGTLRESIRALPTAANGCRVPADRVQSARDALGRQ